MVHYPSGESTVNEYTSITPGGAPAVVRGHDLSGNVTDDGTKLLSFDYKNRLVGVLRKADLRPIAAYGYLPDGRRSRKQVFDPDSGALLRDTRFVSDGPQEVEEQDWNTGTTLATYVWSPVYVDELVEFNRTTSHPLGAGSFYVHQDARCAVVAVSNASGAVVERRRYDDFGNMEVRDSAGQVVAQSTVGLEYGFQGRRHDPETGLIYFRNRMYDPATGRFLQRDPVWDAGNVGGQYSFVGNGPVSGRDPFGSQADTSWRTISREGDRVNVTLNFAVVGQLPPPDRRLPQGATPGTPADLTAAQRKLREAVGILETYTPQFVDPRDPTGATTYTVHFAANVEIGAREGYKTESIYHRPPGDTSVFAKESFFSNTDDLSTYLHELGHGALGMLEHERSGFMSPGGDRGNWALFTRHYRAIAWLALGRNPEEVARFEMTLIRAIARTAELARQRGGDPCEPNSVDPAALRELGEERAREEQEAARTGNPLPSGPGSADYKLLGEFLRLNPNDAKRGDRAHHRW